MDKLLVGCIAVIIFLVIGGLITLGMTHLTVWTLEQFGIKAPFWGVFAGWFVLSAVGRALFGSREAVK